jgi:hypothetical protein
VRSKLLKQQQLQGSGCGQLQDKSPLLQQQQQQQQQRLVKGYCQGSRSQQH